jgi:NAD(P)-dependent dehydrogenase (short-subunit alcohol dehydrogenase family)
MKAKVCAMPSPASRRRQVGLLVNNAGVFVVGQVGAPDSDVAALERQFAINVGGVAAAVRAASPSTPCSQARSTQR